MLISFLPVAFLRATDAIPHRRRVSSHMASMKNSLSDIVPWNDYVLLYHATPAPAVDKATLGLSGPAIGMASIMPGMG